MNFWKKYLGLPSAEYHESSQTLARSGAAFLFGSALLSKVLWSFPNEACCLCELAQYQSRENSSPSMSPADFNYLTSSMHI